MTVYVLAVQGTSLIAKAIQKATKSPYSHCAFLVDQLVYEADWFGITTRHINDYKWAYDKFKIVNLTDPKRIRRLIDSCVRSVGVKYDYLKALGFYLWFIFNWPWAMRVLDNRKALTCWEYVWIRLNEVSIGLKCSYEKGCPACIPYDPAFEAVE